MDFVLWMIFLWLLTNAVLGVILFLAVRFSTRFGQSKPAHLISNDAKQSSEESLSLGERDQMEMREIGKKIKPSKAG